MSPASLLGAALGLLVMMQMTDANRGDATAYSAAYDKDATGRNSCGFGKLPDKWERNYAALPSQVFNRGSDCGRCLRARGTESGAPGTWVKMMVVDECASCGGNGDVDMSFPAFKATTGFDFDRKRIEWEWTSCDGDDTTSSSVDEAAAEEKKKRKREAAKAAEEEAAKEEARKERAARKKAEEEKAAAEEEAAKEEARKERAARKKAEEEKAAEEEAAARAQERRNKPPPPAPQEQAALSTAELAAELPAQAPAPATAEAPAEGPTTANGSAVQAASVETDTSDDAPVKPSKCLPAWKRCIKKEKARLERERRAREGRQNGNRRLLA